MTACRGQLAGTNEIEVEYKQIKREIEDAEMSEMRRRAFTGAEKLPGMRF